jgi:hypothetical protein
MQREHWIMLAAAVLVIAIILLVYWYVPAG